MAWIVYKHTSPNGKVYIGITHQKAEYRWRDGKGYKSNTRFFRAICKYGWNGFTHEIIADNLTENEAVRYETDLIKQYDSANKKHGYNVTPGGHVLSEESRKKIGDTRRKRNYTSHTKGKHLSVETREKISEANRGRHYTLSDKARENIRRGKLGSKNPNYGKGVSEKAKIARLEKTRKPVIQINGSKRIRYESIVIASQHTGVQSSNIGRACSGERLTAGGYRWEYA